MQKCVVVVAAAIGILFSPLCISTFTGFSGTASAAAQKSYGEKEAVRTAEEALNVAEKTFGPDHPSAATSLNNLALIQT